MTDDDGQVDLFGGGADADGTDGADAASDTADAADATADSADAAGTADDDAGNGKVPSASPTDMSSLDTGSSPVWNAVDDAGDGVGDGADAAGTGRRSAPPTTPRGRSADAVGDAHVRPAANNAADDDTGAVATDATGHADGDTGGVKKQNFHTGLDPVSRTKNSAKPTEFNAADGTATVGTVAGDDPTITTHPWLTPPWSRLTTTPHHAILITGITGVAKREFALALAQLLLCDGDRKPCRRCRQCNLFAAATHPDLHVLTTESEWRDGRVELIKKYCDRYQDLNAREKRSQPSRVIPVDQVRLLIERFAARPHLAAHKVALIVPAERMNINAANALLKLLEEPPAGSFLILVSATPAYLPATIRSRCLQIKIPSPSFDDALAWLAGKVTDADDTEAAAALKLANGAPLAALKLHADGFVKLHDEFLRGVDGITAGDSALELAAKFNKHNFVQVLDWLHRFSVDAIKAAGTNDAAPEQWFALYDKIGYYRKIARDAVNEQLALEELTLTLQHALTIKNATG